jgi:hypothetical protein
MEDEPYEIWRKTNRQRPIRSRQKFGARGSRARFVQRNFWVKCPVHGMRLLIALGEDRAPDGADRLR